MNLDESRLRDIQKLKKGYAMKMPVCNNIDEYDLYYEKFQELEEEEKKILERCKVKI